MLPAELLSMLFAELLMMLPAETLAEAAGGLGKDWSRTKYSEIDLVPARSAGPAT